MPRVPAVRTYLRMDDPAAFRPRFVADPAVVVEPLQHCSAALYRKLYHDVGSEWHWHDRDAWTDERLAAHLGRGEISVHVLRVDGEIAGYFEIERKPGGEIELLYFGIVGKFIGRGLGAHLLSTAVRDAWRMGAAKICLNTCTLDHPGALANYRARGFTPYREESYEAVIVGPEGEEAERHGT